MQLKFIYFAFVQLFKILYDALRIGQGTKTTTTNFDDDNGTPLFRFSFYAHVFFTYFPHPCRYVLSHIHTSTIFFPLIWARAYEIHFRTLFVKTLCVLLLLLFEQKKTLFFTRWLIVIGYSTFVRSFIQNLIFESFAISKNKTGYSNNKYGVEY